MDNFEKFYTKVLKYLSYRPRSEKEIRDYLAKKKVDTTIIEVIIKTLYQQKFLNDQDFAKMWVRSRTSFSPRSTRVIKMELEQKGIDEGLIEEALNQEETKVDDLSLARKIATRRMKRLEKEEPQKQKEKLTGFLGRQGFNWDIIKKVINESIKDN